MKLHIATIRHDHGADGFADTTRDGLLEQIADYCRACWGELGRADDPPADNLATVTEYFSEHPSESYDVAEADLIEREFTSLKDLPSKMAQRSETRRSDARQVAASVRSKTGTMKTFTVIGFYAENGQTIIGEYRATDIDHAMERAWSETEDDLLIVAVAAQTPELQRWDYVQAKPLPMRDQSQKPD